MLRDFKFMRKKPNLEEENGEESENLPINPNKISLDSSRPILVPIQDPCQVSKCVSEQEMSGIKANRFDRTPTKTNSRLVSGKTPEKSKNRFGWGQKSEQVVENVSTPAWSTRGVGRANSECNSTQSTPTKSVSKVTNGGICLASGSRPPLSHGGGNRMLGFSKGLPAVVTSVEVPYFALKEDSSFWMDHNVQVLIRIRPLNNMEKSSFGFSRCLKQESSQCVTWVGQPETRFTFDHVACEAIEQETLFKMVGLPMVENCLSGYNSCMFAYGQTGSGKTFTMLGEIDGLEVNPSSNRGMTPRIFEFLFARIREEEQCRRDERLKYTCKCSFLEIYNEQITDLLDPSATNLMLREDMNKGVYVENLSEFEVHTVGDILHLLSEGSSNRRVASTNMNNESSRSHSVFTCVIESSWERDSTSNFRFARLNLVDLAGSERQKSSGAEGERLKEAANINRSLSTLGHVIMVLVDVAHGKTKHIPYRDSRLTFLLQDSLGGNSKTIIIANVTPSICSAAETLNTLKFAQRAKMIQNNAIINEDSSGDVSALRLQIRLLKEELSALKHERVNRSLSFAHGTHGDIRNKDEGDCNEQMLGNESHGVLRVSCKQLKSLETTLAGAFRREQMAETSIKQLEAEIEQLNRLVSQREEDTRCTKMMLRFREDKIQRMESVMGGSISADDYLMEENAALSEEIKLLRAKIDKNPEVTRFALENIRLLEQVRRFQELYEEGEREILMGEITELRNQLIFFVNANSKHSNHLDMKGSVTPVHASDENKCIQEELRRTISELEESKTKLATCLNDNEKLRRELEELHASSTIAFAQEHDCSTEVIKESIVEVPSSNKQPTPSTHGDKEETKHGGHTKHVEEITYLQLELDIMKIILQEERSHRAETEENSKETIISATKECEKVHEELKEAKLVIEALESQQMLSINEIDDLRNSNIQYEELLNNKELAVSSLKMQETRDLPVSRHSDKEESRLEAKLKKMHESLEKAKIMNQCYRSGILGRDSSEEETEEVRKQVEAETAEVIVCLQEELSHLQQEIDNSKIKEVENEGSLNFLKTEMKILEDQLRLKAEENENLAKTVQERENELRIVLEEREVIRDEIEGILSGGTESLKEAQEQIDFITISFPDKASWVLERFGQMKNYVAEKEMAVEKLHRCLEDAMESRNDLENMLRSLRGAALVITETHQQESIEKEKEVFLLTSKLNKLEKKIKNGEDRLGVASSCATAALVIVNRFSEIIFQKDAAFSNQVKIINEGNEKAHSLQMDLEVSEDCCSKLMRQLSDEHMSLEALKIKLEETENDRILEAEEKLKNGEDRLGVASSCATAALVIVNRFSEIISQRDAAFNNQVKIINEGNEKAHSLQMDLEASEDCCSKLMRQLSDERTSLEALRIKLEETENDRILEAEEKLKELNCGVSTLKLCMDEYLMKGGDSQNDAASKKLLSLSSDEYESRTGTGADNGVKHLNSSNLKDVPLKASNSVASESKISRDATIVLLRKEIESALKSFHGVQAQMAKLQSEKDEILTSEKHSRKSLDSLMNQTVLVQESMNSFESKFQLKFSALDGKLVKMEELVQETCTSWLEQKELLEAELDDAKVIASQKSIEASCILEKFGEVQDTMKEADIMINELMIANEVLKHNACQLKDREFNLIGERDTLMNEIEALKSSNNQKDQNFMKLEKRYAEEFDIMMNKIVEIEQVFSEISTSSMEEWVSLSSDFHSMKSHFHESTEFIKSLIEELWSEIIVKDCAVSVLHLCHMGILLETANGLNAENGLLQNGLCKSNASISELREHNTKSQRELEICRSLSGKLLTDIKNGLDRVSSKVNEEGEFTLQLKYFEKKIEDLQSLEEMMLEKSNEMGSELAMLMKELDQGNRQAMVSLVEQEMLLKDKDELFEKREECLSMEILVKDFESVILSSELMQMSSTCIGLTEGLESFKKDVIFKTIDTFSNELILMEEFKMNETALCLNTQKWKNDICILEKELHDLQMNLVKKDEELGKMTCNEEETKILKGQFEAHKKEYCVLLQELEGKRENVSVLEDCIAKLEEDLNQSRVNAENYQISQTVEGDMCSRIRDLETQLENVNTIQNENMSLRNELNAHKISESEYLTALSLQKSNSVDLVKKAEAISSKIIDLAKERFVEIDDMFRQTLKEVEKTHIILEQFNNLENIASQLDSEVVSIQMELLRKDDVVKGLLFDLSMLQESASNSKDQKDETKELKDSLMSLEREFEVKSVNLDKAIAENQILVKKISALELEIARQQERVSSLLSENCKILSSAEDSLEARISMEKELEDARIKCQNLQMEITEREVALAQMSETIDSLKGNLENVTVQADNLDNEVCALRKELESTRALAEEHEAIAVDAQEIAELRKVHAEEKEEEVKLLERSIEELECTINVLEQKVAFVKEEAERQRLDREELEMELLSVKEQMQNVESNDSELKRLLDEKEKKLQNALQRVQLLEREIAVREDEISRCKAHISELNFHAEAQACEYKQKFKSLEAMVEQVKSEVPTTHSTCSSPNKLERKSSKPRGSGSPFKCMGLGLVQQVKSEQDEELTAGKQRIEELEALASSRQKEILMLKARLASTESMTHDVIRDLLGVKLNMSSYATLMDNQQLQTITEKTQHHNAEVDVKDQEVANLKLQIKEFIKEKNGWLEEIERKQAEVMAAHVAIEKLRQQDQFIVAENGMLKMENSNHKKKVTELEMEVKKLSGHQNIQQRIHHHAKIKDENNLLRHQNEDLSMRLRKTEAILSRVEDELAQFRASNGRNPYIDFDEEERLDKKLKEAEEERLQLAGKLLSLCTTVLKAAGIRRPTSEINLSVAEEALHQLRNRVVSLEMELQDAKLKNRISDERSRMSELRPQTSTSANSRVDENCQTRNRFSPTSFISAFDR